MPRDADAPTVVIVHGAWVGATAWREVIALLQVKGLRVIAAQIPLNSLADDVDTVTRAIKLQADHVVLVGHGYGGTVITQAGNHSDVVALVYVAAFAPDAGESTADAQKDFGLPPSVLRLRVDAGGFLYLAPEALLEFFAHDLPAVESQVLAAAQKPIRASALLDRVSAAAWRTKPSWYAVSDGDRMIAPSLQYDFANRIDASVFILSTGHAPFLSKPKETADVILTAAQSLRCRGSAGEAIATPSDRE